MFITFEGIDGSGKSTQIELLSEYLLENKIEFISIREPGGTDIAEQIRNILLASKNEMNGITELMLFEAARADLTEKVILPALKQNKLVLSDRFFDSSTAYQGYGRGLDIQSIEKCNQFATQNLLPDITFYLHLSPEIGIARRKHKDLDRMEQSGLEFFKNVTDGFLELCIKHPERFVLIDASQTKEQVFQIILNIILDKIN